MCFSLHPRLFMTKQNILYESVCINYPRSPVNSHRKFPTWNIYKIPQLSFPWKVSAVRRRAVATTVSVILHQFL